MADVADISKKAQELWLHWYGHVTRKEGAGGKRMWISMWRIKNPEEWQRDGGRIELQEDLKEKTLRK